MLTVAPHAPAQARTQVHLCGSLAAHVGGLRVDGALPGRKGRLLFACLVMSRRHAVSRDELIDILWPRDAPADPDGAFSTLLTRMRTALGRDVVVGRSELLLDLGDDAWVDWEVARGGAAAAEERLAGGAAATAFDIASDALDIARRPLLPGLSAPWLEDRRRALLESRAALLEVHGRAAFRLGADHLAEAERSARELIAVEPYRESAHALLMEIHAARGNLAEALRVFDSLRRMLREELGLSPSRTLSALAGRLLDDKPAVTADVTLPATIAAVGERPLVGREPEVGRLMASLARGCRLLALTGEPGIGKSRVAAEVAARAHAGGYQVLHGRCERDGVTPYQPFVEALRRRLAGDDSAARCAAAVLRPELAELARLLPELRTVVESAPDGGDEHRLFEGVAGLCETLARQRPLLLVLEDLQWADAPTLRLLRHVVRAVHGVDIGLVVTLRDDEPLRPELRMLVVDLLHERTLERVTLGPLDEREVAELLVARRGSALDGETVAAIRAQAGGNPFFVEELSGGDVPSAALPASVRDAVELRLDRLTAVARSVLRAAAGVGQTFDVTTVARRAEAAPAATREAVREAMRTGLVVTDGARPERFAFRHGLVRRTLLAQ